MVERIDPGYLCVDGISIFIPAFFRPIVSIAVAAVPDMVEQLTSGNHFLKKDMVETIKTITME